MLKIVMTSDEDIKKCILAQLEKRKEKYGKKYCPCSLDMNDDTVCMCKTFREQNFAGECHCGLYEKIEID